MLLPLDMLVSDMTEYINILAIQQIKSSSSFTIVILTPVVPNGLYALSVVVTASDLIQSFSYNNLY